ncbi:hypothetical protein EUGRSUZ_A01329 [Eucalyptus grandis]|uniref:Uncharacterized protein n=2 Tax=Eucalyptus grandis TaxID=71139 RepID=A0ACC3M026_EUCGR|nr:hypothetical protein EUGRSUZ_A01329 [Eucalyptus grandis]
MVKVFDFFAPLISCSAIIALHRASIKNPVKGMTFLIFLRRKNKEEERGEYNAKQNSTEGERDLLTERAPTVPLVIL